MKKKLIIIGGGFGGVTLAKRIFKKGRRYFDVTLIDKKDYQLFYPALFGTLRTSAGIAQSFSSTVLKFDDIFRNDNVKIIKNEVVDVLSKENKIKLKTPPRYLTYDYLVLAAGSESAEKKLSFNSFEDALEIKTRLEKIFKSKAKRENIAVAVVGAGFTGCELAGFLENYLYELAAAYGHPHDSVKLFLIEAGPCVLRDGSGWLRNKVSGALGKMGVTVLLDTKKIPENADLVIWTIGVKSALFAKEKGRNLFFIKVASAQSAIHQAKYIARFLLKKVRKKKTRPYKVSRFFSIIELGGGYAFADLGVIKLRGWLARFMRRMAFLRYFISALGFRRAVAQFKKLI